MQIDVGAWQRAKHRPPQSMPGLQAIDQAGAGVGQIQDIGLQSDARNDARQLRQVGCQAQAVQIIPE
jgi:hypothetical protein